MGSKGDNLDQTELLDHFSQQQLSLAPSDSSVVGFRDAEFQWLGSSECDFKLKLKVLFCQNCINLILGPTGAGNGLEIHQVTINTVIRSIHTHYDF